MFTAGNGFDVYGTDFSENAVKTSLLKRNLKLQGVLSDDQSPKRRKCNGWSKGQSVVIEPEWLFDSQIRRAP